MDIIYECAARFVHLTMCEYRFVVSKRRQQVKIMLDFQDTDFFHLAGLQYLTDINIPRNKRVTLDNILFKKLITDKKIQKSRKYTNPEPDKDVKSRMEELRFLEDYIDNDNIISIFTMRNMRNLRSYIDADYVIKSKLPKSSIIVYIFLKQRNENPERYGLVSFFVEENVPYGGDKLYWLLKEKRTPYGLKELFKHPNYENE